MKRLLNARMKSILAVSALALIATSCGGKGTMCYAVDDNKVTVKNTPWGEKSCAIANPQDDRGGRSTASLTFESGSMTGTDYKYNADGSWKAETTIYVEKEPRIKVIYDPGSGVESVTVDGKAVPKC